MEQGLAVSLEGDVTVARFRDQEIADPDVLEALSHELYALVETDGRRKLVLDFSDVKFLSSQMLAILITLQKKAALIDGRTVVCGLEPGLSKVFRVTHLTEVLTFAAGRDEAIELLK